VPGPRVERQRAALQGERAGAGDDTPPPAVKSRAIASYHWTFGDGASASGATATHAYGSAGSYAVTPDCVGRRRPERERDPDGGHPGRLAGHRGAPRMSGITGSLAAKLRAAQASLLAGNRGAAVNQLQAFENQWRRSPQEPHRCAGERASLAAAGAVIASIQSGG